MEPSSLVSVVIPVHNRGKSVARAIESALGRGASAAPVGVASADGGR